MKKCKEMQSQYKLCKYQSKHTSNLLDKNGKISAPPKENEDLHKNQFIVKVQIPMQGSGPLLIYNRDKSFSINLEMESNTEIYSQLRQKIASEGFKGMKGYFHAVLKPGDKHLDQFRINADNILPLEPW